MGKRTKMSIETDSLLVVRGRHSTRAWCSECGADVEWIDLDQTGVISNLEPSELEQWFRSGDLHRHGAAGGSRLTCLNSLLARAQTTVTRPPAERAAATLKKEKL